MAGYNQAFSPYYDLLTANVDYPQKARFLLEQTTRLLGKTPQMVLDLACGTGSLALAFARLGVEVIGVDGSQEMLSQAVMKSTGVLPPVLFLCQKMEELDLYGTVEVAVCTLDSLNHLAGPQELNQVFGRLRYFVEPGGLFVFDLNTRYKHRQVLGDNAFVFDTPQVYCVWQNTCNPDDSVDISLDFFVPEKGNAYRRWSEDFREVFFSRQTLLSILADNGFRLLEEQGDYTGLPPGPQEERILYFAQWM